MKALTTEKAIRMGYSKDKRKRRRQHRQNAKHLLNEGGFFNGYSARGSTFGEAARWHLAQARAI